MPKRDPGDAMQSKGGRMLAAQATGKGLIGCTEAPSPQPGDGQALVRMELASICGSDLHIVDYGWLADEWPLRPGYPGHEGVGVIVRPGASGRFREGDRVLVTPQIWGSFCFAEYQAVGEAFLTPMPDPPAESGVTLQERLMAQQLGTVIFAARRLPNLIGKTCAVMGQGSAGLFWDFVLKRLGAERVIAIEPLPHRLGISRLYGADEQISGTFAAATSDVQELTGGEGADVVVEAVGSPETLSHAIELARPEGQIVWFGVPQTAEAYPFNFDLFFRKRVSAYSPLGAQDEPDLASFRQALRWIDTGEINMKPVVTHSYPLSQVAEAFETARSRQDGAVKVSLVC
ncbi:MAG: zinc-binding dehydrogenase [Chloroflexota bacterium]